jgi:hypothetical protein
MATVAVHGVTDSIKHKTSKSLSVTLATPLFKISILTPDTEQSGSCHTSRDHDRGLKPFGRANVSGTVTVRLVDGIPGKERKSALWAWITRGKPPTRDQMHRIDTHYAQR